MENNHKIGAIIVDDEERHHETLSKMISNFCPEIEILGDAYNVEEASGLIDSKKPQLVFLDIEIAFEGKELIEIFDNYSEEKGVLFILSNNQIFRSNYFDGDLIENELENLNNDTDPEYQNWRTHEFTKLDIEIAYEELDERLKSLKIER